MRFLLLHNTPASIVPQACSCQPPSGTPDATCLRQRVLDVARAHRPRTHPGSWGVLMHGVCAPRSAPSSSVRGRLHRARVGAGAKIDRPPRLKRNPATSSRARNRGAARAQSVRERRPSGSGIASAPALALTAREHPLVAKHLFISATPREWTEDDLRRMLSVRASTDASRASRRLGGGRTLDERRKDHSRASSNRDRTLSKHSV